MTAKILNLPARISPVWVSAERAVGVMRYASLAGRDWRPPSTIGVSVSVDRLGTDRIVTISGARDDIYAWMMDADDTFGDTVSVQIGNETFVVVPSRDEAGYVVENTATGDVVYP